jgi:hypothetical protein
MKTNILITLLSILILFYSLSSILGLDCPLNLVDESYPGSCGRYIDTNQDNLCDLSQETIIAPNTELKIPLTQVEYKSFLEKIRGRYNFLPITFLTILAYYFTIFLVKKGKLNIVNHKKIWNLLLLVSFIAVAFTSIFYLLQADFSLNFLPINQISFWHIELGIIMLVLSLFHAFWHLIYYKHIIS